MINYNNGKTFLKAEYDNKFGCPVNNVGDVVFVLMGYEEFAYVDTYFIRDAVEQCMETGKTFETVEDLVEELTTYYI